MSFAMELGATDKVFLEKNGLTFRKSLGKGGFGKVVKAYSTQMNKNFAVKIIDGEKKGPGYLERILPRELEIMKTLNHPNIIKTYRVFEKSSSKVFVVTELCVNGDLSEYLETKGPLSEECSRRFFVQLCSAVQYLHSISVAHRDLKCENLLLDCNNNIKVCDFSLSKRLTYSNRQVDLSKSFCGTHYYTAPEILGSLPYNPIVADVWSMGVILFKMLHNSYPFWPKDVSKMVKLQRGRKIKFPNTPHVSPEAEALIHRLLHPDTEHRISIASVLENPWMKIGEDNQDPEEGTSDWHSKTTKGKSQEEI